MMRAVLLLALTMAVCGCQSFKGGGGPIRIDSIGDEPKRVEGSLTTAICAPDPYAEASCFVTDRPFKELLDDMPVEAQILHVAILWYPKAGRTPLDPGGTNVSLRYVIVSNGEVGVYGGGGFAWVEGRPDDSSMSISIDDSTLKLLDATSGFSDQLGQVRISGSFRAETDPRLTRRTRFVVSQMVTDALGWSRFVRTPARY